MSARRRTARTGRPGPSVVLGASLLTLGLAALLLVPMAGEPGHEAAPSAGPEGAPSAGPEGAPEAGGRQEGPARALERDGAAEPAPWDRIRVEVLNAGGVPGMAAQATDLLREAGFDVVYFGNARAFGREESLVLDRTGNLEAARRVARAVGVDQVQESLDPDLLVDVSVLLGSAWTPPPPGVDDEEEGEWWSPRRLLDRMRSLDRN